ncbi:MAG: hypothetical protein HY231_18285 [Acidobacteria bacterium]|nr:hypothetical protein [Acidobacteriota bacterium]
MKRSFALLLVILTIGALRASAASISMQAITLTGWNDTRTSVELWIFSDNSWTDASGISHGAGSPQDRAWSFRVSGLTVNTASHTITIPAFSLTSTRDALRNPNVRYFAWFMAVSGASATPIKIYPNLENGFQVPATIASTSGCSPAGTCAAWADLIVYNKPSPQLPVDGYYTRTEVDRLIVSQLSGAPLDATYITQTANAALTAEQALGSLATGLLKNTTGTGVLALGVAGTDYENPLSFSSPLSRATNSISLPAATGSQDGYLSSADWTAFNSKQNALGYTAENAANKNATNGYAGLTSGRLSAASGQEVWSVTDLTTYSGTSGSGTTAILATITAPASGQGLTWNGTNWVNSTLVPTTRAFTAGTGLTGGGDLSQDRSFSVVNDTTTQRLEVLKDGTAIGTRKALNFITGSNTTLTVADDSGNNRINVTVAASGTLGVGWHNLTDPSANLALAMAANTTTFTYGNSTGALTDLFTLKDSASNTGSGHLLVVNTAAASAAKPLLVAAGGTANGVEMNTAGILSALGTGGITATTGDSATAFFPAGQLEAARGGTGLDTSAATGVVRVAGGTWSANAGVSHLAASTSADLYGVITNETGAASGTPLLVFNQSPTIVTPSIAQIINTGRHSSSMRSAIRLPMGLESSRSSIALIASPSRMAVASSVACGSVARLASESRKRSASNPSSAACKAGSAASGNGWS